MVNLQSALPANLPKLLQSLGDGQYHSGEALGEILGVSRTAVWKHLKKLEPLGLVITSVKGKGYCLEGGLELLDEARIRSGLMDTSAPLLRELALFLTLDSTNTTAMQSSIGSGYVCLAEQQLAGRGRRGRDWVSPFGRNIYLSAVWHFEGGVAALEGLSLAVGVAVVEALADLGLSGAQLKWPNDILFQGRKLAGILLEMSGDVSGACKVVVGVGLNVSMPSEVAEAIDQPWCDIARLASSMGVEGLSRNQLVAALLNRLLPLLASYQSRGFVHYLPSWQVLDAFAGAEVELRSGNRVESGVAEGVTVDGALRLRVGDEIKAFSGGEVSLRKLEK